MSSLWRDALLVALGAVPGALLRFAVSTVVPGRIAPFVAFPWATLVVNLVGSFFVGLVLLREGAGQDLRMWLVVGFLGAFTTVSAYSAETVDLWRSGHTAMAFANVAANALGGPLMAWAGWKASQAMAGNPA